MVAKYKQFDEVVSTIMVNVVIERQRNGKFLLYGFDPDSDEGKLYFNVTALAADMDKENIYLNTSLLNYVKFRVKNRNRKNIKWARKVEQSDVVSVSTLMDFIYRELNLAPETYRQINREYYSK